MVLIYFVEEESHGAFIRRGFGGCNKM